VPANGAPCPLRRSQPSCEGLVGTHRTISSTLNSSRNLFIPLSIIELTILLLVARRLYLELDGRTGGFRMELHSHCYRCHRLRDRFLRVVLPSLRQRCLRHDSGRRRVSFEKTDWHPTECGSGMESSIRDGCGTMSDVLTGASPHRLHATQYPWEHEKWQKTFDHQAYVLCRSAVDSRMKSDLVLAFAVVSRSTRKSAPPATPSLVFLTALSSVAS
jgi:hypothetical protein